MHDGMSCTLLAGAQDFSWALVARSQAVEFSECDKGLSDDAHQLARLYTNLAVLHKLQVTNDCVTVVDMSLVCIDSLECNV